jgi:ABC-type multidrug transport system ATPase subunit
VAEEMCDRISIILKGRIIARGTVDELRAQAGDAPPAGRGAAGGRGEEDQLTEVFLKLTGGSALQEIDEAVG